jgi:hypothetical protein
MTSTLMDLVLMVIVCTGMMLALGVDVAALLIWVSRRWR